MNKKNPQVDGYLRKSKQWHDELQELRRIILDSPLVEEIKWRVPVYTLEEKNIIFLGRFKESCVISFVKGALMKDAKGLLVKPGENTQSTRFIRFTDIETIRTLEPVLKAYIAEAITIEKSGLKVQFKKTSDFAVPQEFQDKLKEMPALKMAFKSLTPGRQRAYLLHFASAKQSKTRASRVEKCIPHILNGKGIDDDQGVHDE
jgi:uncharacterized protein YdeI (YjbR/CyaY-like superfamily)